MSERPEGITQEHLDFLDEVREGGGINMFAAARPIQGRFGVDYNEAKRILKYWMDTFGEEDR
jgi:hypothetical protein